MGNEDASLLASVNEDSVDSSDVNVVRKHVKCISYVKNITVEPVMFGSMFIIILYSTLSREYIFTYFSEQYGLVKNGSDEICNASYSNQSDPQHQLEEKVSEETSKWVLYLNIVGFVTASITTVIFGSWSDKVGRKIPLLISCFGLLCIISVYIIVINLHLPVPFLLIGHFLCGLFGDFSTILACTFAHISDVTKENTRTFRVALGDACLGVGGLAASLSGGFWVNTRGFKEPFWFMLGVAIANLVYVTFCIESKKQSNFSNSLRDLFKFQPFVDAYRVIRLNDGKKRHITIPLYSLCFMIALTVYIGIESVITVYEIGIPFCWSFATVGISLAIFNIAYFVALFLIKVFRGLKAEFRLVMTSVISSVASCLTLALASLSWHIFLGIGLRSCGNIAPTVVRSQLSKLVSADETGAVFSLLSLAQNIASLSSSLIFNGIFALTVQTSMPGAVFFAGIVLYAIFFVLYCIAYRMSKESLEYGEMHEKLEEN